MRLRDGMIEPIAVRLLPRKTAERLDAIAMFKVRDTITVAMADPQNLEHLDEIERITSLHVRAVFALIPTNSANSLRPGKRCSGARPPSPIRALIFESASPALVSLMSLSTISTGVFLGGEIP